MNKRDELKEVILETIEEHQKNMELKELREKVSERPSRKDLMIKGFWETLIPFTIETFIWILLFYLLGLI